MKSPWSVSIQRLKLTYVTYHANLQFVAASNAPMSAFRVVGGCSNYVCCVDASETTTPTYITE